MQRFFLPREAFSADWVIITQPEVIHHICDVLRLGWCDEIICLDNSGWEYQVVLDAIEAGRITGQIREKRLSTNEPHVKVALYQSVLKGDRFEWVLQKGTEVGMSEFIPMLSERCIVQDANQLSKRKAQRWGKVIRAAAEQSRRGRLPPLQPMALFAVACERVRSSAGLALIPWEEASTPLRQVLEEAGRTHRPFNVSLLVGPEGGFSPAEVQLARDYGVIPVSLGPRILRAETAGVVTAALVLYHYEDSER